MRARPERIFPLCRPMRARPVVNSGTVTVQSATVRQVVGAVRCPRRGPPVGRARLGHTVSVKNWWEN
eukprot:1828708-Pyramimonas_sp.AAC.1